jgi:hypothetical protein
MANFWVIFGQFWSLVTVFGYFRVRSGGVDNLVIANFRSENFVSAFFVALICTLNLTWVRLTSF